MNQYKLNHLDTHIQHLCLCVCIAFFPLISTLAHAMPSIDIYMFENALNASSILSTKVTSVEGVPEGFDPFADTDDFYYGPVTIQIEEVIAGSFNYTEAIIPRVHRSIVYTPSRDVMKEGEGVLLFVQENDNASITLMYEDKGIYRYDSKKDLIEGVKCILAITSLTDEDDRIEAMCEAVKNPNRRIQFEMRRRAKCHKILCLS
jgi:hypothetical protein